MTEHEIENGVTAIVNILNMDSEILDQARKTGSPLASVYDLCEKTFL